MGENCTSACTTRDHETWGQCVRSQGQMVAYCNSAGGNDATLQKNFDKSLDRYRAARAEGIQPAGTDPNSVDRAVRLSDAAGKPWSAA